MALGWPRERIIVIDSDLGQSGASAVDRAGFQQLVAEVGMGHAGIVLGLEVSRLARNSTDWHRLLEICALADTLILDEDGLYDPADFNDRLLLGLKGTMSEAELHVLRARLRGGLLNKARRGELALPSAGGLGVRRRRRTWSSTPTSRSRKACGCSSRPSPAPARSTRPSGTSGSRGCSSPRVSPPGRSKGELAWAPLSLGRASSALHNPWYAGAYVYGRSRWRKQADGRARHERLPPEQWHVCLRDAHPAYITWEEYERIAAQLAISAMALGFERSGGPPREGPALLQGRAVCGVCGEPHARALQHAAQRRADPQLRVLSAAAASSAIRPARACWAPTSMPPSPPSWSRPSRRWPSN